MNHESVFGSDLEEPGRCGNRLAGEVHEGLGFEQDHPLHSKPRLGQSSLESALGQRGVEAPAKLVEHAKADRVAMVSVLTAGVTQPADQLHYFFLSSFFASSFLPAGAAAPGLASAAPGAPGLAGAPVPGLASAPAGAAPSSAATASAVGGRATPSSLSRAPAPARG